MANGTLTAEECEEEYVDDGVDDTNTDVVDSVDEWSSNDEAHPYDFYYGRAFRMYCQEICGYPLLSAEEEIIYAKAMADEINKIAKFKTKKAIAKAIQRYQDAKEKMFLGNVRLVVSIALKYTGVMPLMDSIQEGNIALWEKAIEKFDPTLGFKFSTYASWWIRQGITRHIADKGDKIRLPVGLGGEIKNINRAIAKIEKGRKKATIEELMDATELSKTTVERILRAKAIRQGGVLSLNQPRSEEADDRSGEQIDFVKDKAPSPEDNTINKELLERMEEVLATLLPREAEVIKYRFGLVDGTKWTLEQIASVFNITRERVRQIEAKALKKLRHPKRIQRLKEFI